MPQPDDRKDLNEELARVEREGYDKARFCNAECALFPLCDFCHYYDFKPGDCGCYLDAGQCETHGRKDPEEGGDCPDFICSSLREESEYKKKRQERIKINVEKAQQGINVCDNCWANGFCSATRNEEEDDRANPT